MRSFALALLSLAASTGAHGAPPAVDGSSEPAAVGTYIVTFEDPGLVQLAMTGPSRAQQAKASGRGLDVWNPSAKHLREDIASDRQLLLASAAGLLGRDLQPEHVYELALNGVALTLSHEEAMDLAAMPGIRRVELERTYQLQTDLSAEWLGANAIWNAPAPFGNKGEGVVIGIIDSGLNRQHPSFAGTGPVDGYVHTNPHGKVYGRCVAAPSKCNGKVIGIYDFTEEGLLDGIDQSSHGSLVAGIAAGNAVDVVVGGKLTRIAGIAPHASLIVYKTCLADANGSCTVGDIIAALEQAIEDGVDVVNLSLGYAPNNPFICLGTDCNGPEWDSLGEVTLNVHAAGIVGVAAAGNAGPIPRSVLAPATAPWMLTVASAKHDRVPDEANQLASSSGRGPGLIGGYLLPDVTAPGVKVIGAGAGPGTVTGFGTSMASPQVAGAAALLRGAHPDWTVADIASVLVTTARPVIVLEDGTPAGLFDQGGGLVDLSRALDAGLSMRINADDYRAVNPHGGSSVAAMNEPALILEQCFRTCTVTRTFTAVTSGSWSVVAEAAEGVSVTASPATFTLTAGETQAVSFSINAEPRAGEWTYGAVRLQRTDASAPDTRLPLAVFADPGPVPAEVVIQASSDAGFADVALPGLVGLPKATFAATGAGEVFTRTEALPKAPSPNPFTANGGGADGAFAQFITIPANSGALTLKVWTLDSPAVNVDLYAGRDINGNGKTDQIETECASTSIIEQELCEVAIPNRGTDANYWFVAINRVASTPGATDLVTARWSVAGAGASDNGPLTVTGPGHVDSGAPFSVRVSWKDFTLTPGAERESELLIGDTPDRLGQVGTIRLKLVRGPDAASAAAGLVPGQALKVRLLPGEAEDRLYLDVPPNASALSVTLAGSGEVDVHAARPGEPGGPGILPAPARNLATASSSASGANDTLSVAGAQLLPGRWYLTPVNAGTQVAEFTITAALSYDAARAEPRSGAYFNPERSGAGGFLYRAGSAWAYIWYTYLQDGTPAWYLGANAAPGPQDGTWVVPLERYTWNGTAASGTRVGEGILTLVSTTEFRFSWNIDGESGSESYFFIDGGGCPAGATADLTGSWFAPALPGYGFSINAYQSVGSVAVYFYDALGIGRWALGVDNDQTGSMVMSQYQGVGPLAAYQAPVPTEIGTFERSFTSQTAGTGHLDLQLAAPLSGGWSTDHALQRLTDILGCD